MRSIGTLRVDAPIRRICSVVDLIYSAEGVLGTAASDIIQITSTSTADALLLFGWLVGEHDGRLLSDMDPQANGSLDTTRYGIEE